MEINYFSPADQLLDESFVKVHLRVIKRNNRKCTTQIEGLPIGAEEEFNKLMKTWKKSFSCNGHVELDEETQQKVIILQGDHRDSVKKYLLKKEIVSNSSDIIIHGF